MPAKAPRICRCGKIVPGGERCTCEARDDAERKARWDKRRPSSSARGYNRAWEKARKSYLAKHPFCGCGQLAVLVDHITPHKGDQALFWDSSNWQPMCTHCHSSAKQRAERKGR